MMESARRGANRMRGLEGQACCRLTLRRSDLFRHPSIPRALPGWANSSFLYYVPVLGGHREGEEDAVVSPHRPGDASELVGQSDGGLVAAYSSLEAECPAPEAVVGLGVPGVTEDGASAVDEQHPQVGVAALGDSA